MDVIRRIACMAGLAATLILPPTASGAATERPTQPTATRSSAAKAGSRESHTPPNIVLITLDTTRADRMGFLGSTRGLTPNLDGLARDSAVFTRAYSQAPLTPTSHATILTGTYPQDHKVLSFPLPLAKTLPYLPEILRAHGYHTAAFVGSIALDPQWGAPGFERGFDTYGAGFVFEPGANENRYETTERRAGDVVRRALVWLDKRPRGPFFLWVHLFDPHDPYDPPEPYKTRYAKALYDGEIAYMDSALRRLFAQLKSDGLYDGTVIAVTADHGESLGAHGEDQHGIFLYDETIRVPLLIKLPQSRTAGRRVEIPVELADLMPTLLETAGIEVPKEVQGASMVELLKLGKEGEAAEAAWRDRGAYSQADYGHLAFAWSALQSWRTGKYLYIQAPRPELYDSVADRNAENNLATASPAVAETLAAKVKEFQQKTASTGEMPKSQLDEARIQRLSAMGYVARINNPALAASPENGADPKDKIGIANALLRINDLLENQNCGEAAPQLRKAIAEDPNISLLHFFLGGCYLEARDDAQAIPELRKAVQLDPGFTHAETILGKALLRTEDYDGAAAAFEDIVKSDPTRLDAHVYLEVIYAKLNRVEDEIRECRTVLQAEPEHYGGNLNLGYFLAQSGDLEGALPWLQKAALLRPTNPMPHIFLSSVYAKLGREEDAKRERAEAERLGAIPNAQPSPDTNPGSTDKQ